MKTVFALIAVAIGVGTLLLHNSAPERMDEVYAKHFETPLPAGCELLQHTMTSNGFQPVHGFAFSAPDRALFSQIGREWKCSVNHEKKSVVSQDPPWWWIDKSRREALDSSNALGRIDFRAQLYWTVFYDPEEGRVYAEYGKQ